MGWVLAAVALFASMVDGSFVSDHAEFEVDWVVDSTGLWVTANVRLVSPAIPGCRSIVSPAS